MPEKKKLTLGDFKVQSFITSLKNPGGGTIRGGYERARSQQLGVCGTCSAGPCCEAGSATCGATMGSTPDCCSVGTCEGTCDVQCSAGCSFMVCP